MKTEVNKIRTHKDNFWSRLRVERQLSINDIAEYLHVSRSTAAAYFTGFLLPCDDIIKELCDLFDVEFMKGKYEFSCAHRVWDARKPGTPKLPIGYQRPPYVPKRLRVSDIVADNSDIPTVKIESESECLPVLVSGDAIVARSEVIDAVLEVVYDELSYFDFMAITEHLRANEDIRSILYHKVNYRTFNKVCSILDNA